MEQPKKVAVPPAAIAAQARSSDAAASVWVSANAGSGKTHVLTERVIRLLLNGTPPARILCLTYTKAAASLMQSRIFARLARWTQLSEESLCEELTKLESAAPDILKINQARRLFASALETPGGLKIQTIHAFCESLLHQFPLEANIPGHFELMDDIAQKNCMEKAKKQLLTEINNNPNSPLTEAFSLILAKVGEFGFNKLLAEAINRKQEIAAYAQNLNLHNEKNLNIILGLEQIAEQAQANKTNIETFLAAEMKNTALFDSADLAKITKIGGEKAQDFVAKLKTALIETDPERLSDTLSAAYFSKGKCKRPVTLFTKKALAVWPELENIFCQKAESVQTMVDLLKRAALKNLNLAAYTLISALLARYAALKQERGLMDFADLIGKTLALLQRKGAGQWVQYKLDRGIDHILVDEAQDTGPEQWAIIRLLSQDFFSGLGAREDLTRTIFAVGDEKQAIYSFQGASPQDFAANGRYIGGKAYHAQKLFRQQNLAFSFRSTADILAAVDSVFALPQNYRGLSHSNEPTVHNAIRLSDQGYVDIWQAFLGEKEEESQDWTQSLDKAESPAVQLAETICRTIALWLKNKEILSSKNRIIETGDIMILVRNRSGEFVSALTRALKNASIPVAGADRLHLTDHIAVRDLMKLGDFVLQPHDDLALACVLKSPLFNRNEEQLFNLTAQRQGTLWEELKIQAKQNTDIAAIAEKLQNWRSFADISPVYEFYSKILAEDGGRQQFLARLGHEAGDILDSFLDYCLEEQKNNLPGLQIFLQNLSENSPEIKREIDQNRNEVRIMTVHAAKGQEAPIVFLVDNSSAIIHSNHTPCLLPFPVPVAIQKNSNLPPIIRIWLPKANYKTQTAEKILTDLKQAAEEEYRRLLYVGMTRAEDRLIVCGFGGIKPQQDVTKNSVSISEKTVDTAKDSNKNTWLPIVRNALAAQAEHIDSPAKNIEALRFWHKKSDLASSANIKTIAEVIIPPVPAFLKQSFPEEPALPYPLIPSEASSIIETKPEINPDFMLNSPILLDKATLAAKTQLNLPGLMEKGTLIHNLLQYLPAIATDKRENLAKNYLIARLGAENKLQIESIMENIFIVLKNPRFAPLFSTKGQSEVALMGLVQIKGQKRAVSGRIDRLAFLDKKIIFADYKTGQPPERENHIPAAYKLQLALYVALLTKFYPNKKIEALLIYTQSGQVFFFNDENLLPLLQK